MYLAQLTGNATQKQLRSAGTPSATYSGCGTASGYRSDRPFIVRIFFCGADLG
jgi:hypothetical protein